MKVRNPSGVVLTVSDEKGARLLKLRGWERAEEPAPAPAVEVATPKRTRRKAAPKTEDS